MAATCTTAGKTEGKHCSACNEVIVAQTTVAAKGHDFGRTACNACGLALPSYTHWNTNKDVVTKLSFDQLYVGDTDGLGSQNIFAPMTDPNQINTGSDCWNRVATVSSTDTVLNFWGWAAAGDNSGTFGYQIDANEPIYSAGFTCASITEQAVVNLGGVRLKISIDLTKLSAGSYTVNALYRNAAGQVVTLCTFQLVILDENGNAPAVEPTNVFTANDLAAMTTTNATASVEGNYAHFLTGGADGDKTDPGIAFTNADGFGDIIVIKYRTNCSVNYGGNYWGYLTLNGATTKFYGNRASSDNWFRYTRDNEWHILVLDMRRSDASNAADTLPDTDVTGGEAITSIGFTFFDYTKKPTQDGNPEYIDIEYIAFFESETDAAAYIG